MLPLEKVFIREPEDERRTWHSLLTNNQYDQITTCLEKAYAQAVVEGEFRRATLLAAAKQLCASCVQLQQEVSFHEQAYHQFETRRNQLNTELNKLLEMIEVIPATVDSPKNPTFWQRVQNFLGLPANINPNKKNDPKIENKEKPDQETHRLEAEEALFPPKPRSISYAKKRVEEADSETRSIIKPTFRDYKPGARSLIIYCLGAFRVYQNDQLLNDWNGLKSLMILKYLVSNRCKPVAKEILMDIFWPEADSEGARRNLHQAVYSLRQTLKQHDPDFQHILYENDCYLFNPDLKVWLDFQEFERHVRNGRRLLTAGKKSAAMEGYGIAESLYQGKFMEEDLYDEWPKTIRRRLQNLYLEIADRLSEYYLDQGEFTIAIALSQKILLHDKCFEQAYYRLMLCYRAQGQRHLAIRYYLNCKETLQEELDLLPSAETVELYNSLIN
jgi:SARP family transcriptional regulator, regulator of embCAB operon